MALAPSAVITRYTLSRTSGAACVTCSKPRSAPSRERSAARPGSCTTWEPACDVTLVVEATRGRCGGRDKGPAAGPAGAIPPIPAAVRHDQRRAPVWLPLPGLRLRPPRGSPSPAAKRPRPRHLRRDDRILRRARRAGDRPGHPRREKVLRPAAPQERLRPRTALLPARG